MTVIDHVGPVDDRAVHDGNVVGVLLVCLGDDLGAVRSAFVTFPRILVVARSTFGSSLYLYGMLIGGNFSQVTVFILDW